MAAFKFKLQQLDILGAYDRYTKELEEQKKEELYDNKLVDQQVDDFNRYYNPKSIRENDLPLLQGSFKSYETAAKALNKARRMGNVDEINKNRDVMQKAVADMGDVYNKSVIAKKVASDMSVLKDQERKGLIVIDDSNYKNYFNLFTAGNLNDIENTEVNGVKLGKPDTWGNVMTGIEYNNNKFNEGLGKTITAFNSNKNNYITSTAPVEFQTQKLATGDEFKIPVFEKAPDYNKALQLAMVQPESMKKKIFQQFNADLAQGGTVSDIARLKQDKIAAIFKKTPDQLTADDLLAYSIAGDARKEADFKQGKETWKMAMEERQFAYKKELDDKKLQIAKARAANKGKGGSGKITSAEITAVKNYYDASKGDFADNSGNIKAGKEAVFQTWLNGLTEPDGTPSKVIEFFHKVAPKSKTDIKEMNKVFQGYMKNPQSLYGAMQ
jgi:hypothetical protein